MKWKTLSIHVMIITFTAVFFFSSPWIYARFIREYGKVTSFDGEIPQPGNELVISPFELSHGWVEDEDVYQLTGWGFPPDLDQKYRQIIVLESNNSRYFFPITPYLRLDIKTIFKSEKFHTTGFKVDIAKNAVPFGAYRIGVLFSNENEQFYKLTNQALVFKANLITLERYDDVLDERMLDGRPFVLTEVMEHKFHYGIDKPIIAEIKQIECVRISGFVVSETIFNQRPVTTSVLYDTGETIKEYPAFHFPRPDVPIYLKRGDFGDPGMISCIPLSDVTETKSRVGWHVTYPDGGDFFQWTNISIWQDQGKYYDGSDEIVRR